MRDRAGIFEKIKNHTNENGINIFETVAQKNFDRYDFAEDDFVWKNRIRYTKILSLQEKCRGGERVKDYFITGLAIKAAKKSSCPLTANC